MLEEVIEKLRNRPKSNQATNRKLIKASRQVFKKKLAEIKDETSHLILSVAYN